MELFPKPKHPTLVEKCSREECQSMVDMASVRILSEVTSLIDQKIDKAFEKMNSRINLLISNAILKLKDELRTMYLNSANEIHSELNRIKDGHDPRLMGKCVENAENIQKLKENVQKLYDAFNDR